MDYIESAPGLAPDKKRHRLAHINALRLAKNFQVKRIAVVGGKFLRKNANLLEMHRCSPVRDLEDHPFLFLFSGSIFSAAKNADNYHFKFADKNQVF
jgi:hypothetical protein